MADIFVSTGECVCYILILVSIAILIFGVASIINGFNNDDDVKKLSGLYWVLASLVEFVFCCVCLAVFNIRDHIVYKD